MIVVFATYLEEALNEFLALLYARQISQDFDRSYSNVNMILIGDAVYLKGLDSQTVSDTETLSLIYLPASTLVFDDT